MSESTQLTVRNLFGKDEVKNKFQEMLGKRAPSFITSVLQIVASNHLLAKADPHSVYHSAAVAATLDLPLNNNLGFAYIVPYNQSVQENGEWVKKQVAQFQLGYKGFKQLALRSGQFKGMNATDVREGELKEHNRLTGYMKFEWVQDEEARLKLPIVGYVSHFELLNGFSQSLYMSMAKLNEHGKKYSQTFKNGKGLWKDDFDSMALKTVTKLNLSKNAPLSVDMQKAITFDQAVVNDVDTEDVTYVDHSAAVEEVTYEELNLLLESKMGSLTKAEADNAKRIMDNKETGSYNKLHALLTEKTDARPLIWGKCVEKPAFDVLGLEYTLCSDKSIQHPTIPFWVGSPDAVTDTVVADLKCPQTLTSFCQMLEPYYEDGKLVHEAMTIEAVRENHKDGDKFFWQIVSNAVLTGKKKGELIIYVPYFDELETIRARAEGVPEYYWIFYCDAEKLPYLVREGDYKNINVIQFDIMQRDVDFLTERVLECGKKLIQI